MSTLPIFISAFVVNAAWQVPVVALCSAVALRVGRPVARVAHSAWTGALLVSVIAPMVTAVAVRRAELLQASVTLGGDDALSDLPALRPQLQDSLLLRLLHQHLSHGLQPFIFHLDVRASVWITWMWTAVTLMLLGRLLIAFLRMRRLVAASVLAPASVPGMQLLKQQCDARGMALPRVRISGSVAGPALAGIVRPTLLLPSTALTVWSTADLEATFAHELAHLRRRDPLRHAFIEAAAVPVLFHPVAVWMAHRVRQTREMACDADASHAFGSAARYARALLHVAERVGLQPAAPLGLGLFSNQGTMEERMNAILRTPQPQTNRAVRLGTCAALLAVAVAAVGMVQVQPALAAQNVASIASSSQGRTSFTVSSAPALPQSPEVQAAEPPAQAATARPKKTPAATLEASTSAAPAPQRYFQLPNGTTVMAHTEPLPGPAKGTMTVYEDVKTLKISTDVLNGNSLTKVLPVYPPQAKKDGIEGDVVLHILVDKDGQVVNLSLLSTPDQSLSDAALNAVQQGTYRPYLLNGQPIAVESTVTVHFSNSK